MQNPAYSLDYADRPVPHKPRWGLMTVVDVYLNNLALGLYLVTVCALWLQPEAFAPAAVPALLAAWLLLLLDLLLLVLDLGDPLRFHHMLRTFRPFSPMWVGVWALSLSAVCLTATGLWAALDMLAAGSWMPSGAGASLEEALRSKAVNGAVHASMVLGAGAAAAGLLYKGVLFTATSRPGWCEARWFPAWLCCGAVLLGCAALTGISLAVSAPALQLLPGMVLLLGLLMVLNVRCLQPLFAPQSVCRAAFRQACLLEALCLPGLAVVWFMGVNRTPGVWLAVLCLGLVAVAAALPRRAFITSRTD